MKNLCAAKSKGKIYPTPAAGDTLAVLALLPAAALALTAVLGFDDKEVVAYLITRSLNSSLCALSEAEKKRCRKSSYAAGSGGGGAQHRPTFDCGCFDCYTSFWIRWDSSPLREVIHEVIESFEEHLASSEKSKKKASTSRRRDRRESGGDRASSEKGKGKKKVEEPEVLELAAAASGSCCGAEEKELKFEVAPVVEEELAMDAGVEEAEEAAESGCGGGAGGERRKAWPDVMWIFNSRLWSLWSPAA